jgi:hypothetical protein
MKGMPSMSPMVPPNFNHKQDIQIKFLNSLLKLSFMFFFTSIMQTSGSSVCTESIEIFATRSTHSCMASVMCGITKNKL